MEDRAFLIMRVQQVLESETCGPTALPSSMPWGGVQNSGEQGIAQHPQGAGQAQPSFHQYSDRMCRHLCRALHGSSDNPQMERNHSATLAPPTPATSPCPAPIGSGRERPAVKEAFQLEHNGNTHRGLEGPLPEMGQVRAGFPGPEGPASGSLGPPAHLPGACHPHPPPRRVEVEGQGET